MEHHVPGIMMSDHEIDRAISRSTESRIDAVGQRFHLLPEQRIFLDFRTARGGDLDKGKSANPLGLELQEPFDGEKSFKDALVWLNVLTKYKAQFTIVTLIPCILQNTNMPKLN